MDKVKLSKQKAIDKLIAQIRLQKEQIDTQNQKVIDLREMVDAFMTQYELYIRELENRRYALEQQIRQLRNRLEMLSQESSDNSTDEAPDELLETFTADPTIEESSSGFEAEAEPTVTDLEPPTVTFAQDEKHHLLRHFAHFWHSDVNRTTIASVAETNEQADSTLQKLDELMATLTQAYSASADVVEMLIVIPWHEKAWTERREKETPGMQWERLIEWQAHLDSALERIEQRVVQLTQDWRYPLYFEWKQANKQSDFFTDLANREREEIRNLEETLIVLKEELVQVEREKTGSQEIDLPLHSNQRGESGLRSTSDSEETDSLPDIPW